MFHNFCRNVELSQFETAYKSEYHTKINPKGYQNILLENWYIVMQIKYISVTLYNLR